MNFLAGIANGLREVWGHKLRSALTLLCVALGVASLVVVNGFVDGLFVGWKISITSRGGLEKIRIEQSNVPPEQAHLTGISPGMSQLDIARIREFCPEVVAITPEINGQSFNIRRGSKSTYYGRLIGATSDIMSISRYELAEGRRLCDLDEARSQQVMVIGTSIAKQLFEENEPVIGKTVVYQGVPFEIVGLLKKYEQMYGNFNLLEEKNQTAFIPLHTMETKLGQTRYTDIILQVADLEKLRGVAERIESIVLQCHRGVRDTKVHTNEENLASYESTRHGFLIAGGGIGAVSLLVSGIGIMNLMLASIHERVREIGLRKALGAWARDIFMQFLVEAVTLAVLGGLVGVAFGAGIIQLLQGLEESRPMLSANAIVIGFCFSVVIGIFSGLYPAFKASRLDPIDALRYE